jgi:uncharacterized membrane protein
MNSFTIALCVFLASTFGAVAILYLLAAVERGADYPTFFDPNQRD